MFNFNLVNSSGRFENIFKTFQKFNSLLFNYTNKINIYKRHFNQYSTKILTPSYSMKILDIIGLYRLKLHWFSS